MRERRGGGHQSIRYEFLPIFMFGVDYNFNLLEIPLSDESFYNISWIMSKNHACKIK